MTTDLKQTMPSDRDLIFDWWRELSDHPRYERPDRAALARLRRCDDPLDVLSERAFHDLLLRLKRTATGEVDRLAIVAVVLAHVREHVGGVTTAGLLGRPKSEDSRTPRLAEARFTRLMRTAPGPDLLPAFRRVVALLDGQASVADLGISILTWGPQTRRRWMFQYFQAGDALPRTAEPAPVLPA